VSAWIEVEPCRVHFPREEIEAVVIERIEVPADRMKTLVASLVAVFVVALAPPAAACEYDGCQSEGAAAKPAAFEVSLPFTAGETVRVLAGYGPSGGSSLHCRAQDAQCANDYYALDLCLDDHAECGSGEPVLAVASGTVISAEWGSAGWAAYGRRVYIEHDYDADGHRYVSMYAHLSSIAVSEGEHVDQGDPIGDLGSSCNGSDSCSNFSTPHVHFSIHRDPGFGGTGSGGSHGGRAVIPESIDGYSGIQAGQVLVSANDGGGEKPVDACSIVILPDAETILEEDGPCASPRGADGGLQDAEGHGGHAFRTDVDVPAPDYAEGMFWLFDFALAGDYEIAVWLPGGVVELSPAALYKVSHSGQSTTSTVNQLAAPSGWNVLGTFSFAAGEDQWLRLGDNYDTGAAAGSRLHIDAVRIAPPGWGDDDDDAVDDDDDAQQDDDDVGIGDFDPDPEPDTSVSSACSCGGGDAGWIWVLGGVPLGLCARRTRDRSPRLRPGSSYAAVEPPAPRGVAHPAQAFRRSLRGDEYNRW
jgi:hypothetical protein